MVLAGGQGQPGFGGQVYLSLGELLRIEIKEIVRKAVLIALWFRMRRT